MSTSEDADRLFHPIAQVDEMYPTRKLKRVAVGEMEKGIATGLASLIGIAPERFDVHIATLDFGENGCSLQMTVKIQTNLSYGESEAEEEAAHAEKRIRFPFP